MHYRTTYTPDQMSIKISLAQDVQKQTDTEIVLILKHVKSYYHLEMGYWVQDKVVIY